MDVEHSRRARQRARTRTAVLTAARQLFHERGFDQATVVDVARAADVAVQTVFNHVASKEELFFADRVPWAVLLGAAPDLQPGETCPQALVRQLTAATVEYLRGLVDPQALDMAAQVESVPALAQYERVVHTRAEASLAGHLATAGISTAAPLTAALLLTTTRVHAHDHRRAVLAGAPLECSLQLVGELLPGCLERVLAVTAPGPEELATPS